MRVVNEVCEKAHVTVRTITSFSMGPEYARAQFFGRGGHEDGRVWGGCPLVGSVGLLDGSLPLRDHLQRDACGILGRSATVFRRCLPGDERQQALSSGPADLSLRHVRGSGVLGRHTSAAEG